ncbi:LacI family DNA-binding transcriptional regulator [Deinococcus sp.]|uniref:LacI family DNA-binding transcriptional regulator n=1 Tax=Deinococcus sp. TaxID=47478 RepID=UPI003CC67FA4
MESGSKERRRPGLKDIAARLGVSAATVSNAYNRPAHVSPALRETIFQTARELGYAGPDPLARSFRRGQVGAVGVLCADQMSYMLQDPVALQFLQGLSGVTEAAGLSLTLIPTTSALTSLPKVQQAAIDGLVLYSIAQDDPRLAGALARSLPTVVVDQPQLPGLPLIGIDDLEAAKESARHLLKLGHRDFGILALPLAPGGESSQHFDMPRTRLRGYSEAISAAGLEPKRNAALAVCDHNSVQHGREAALKLLTARPEITAILAMSDLLAFGALEAARLLGRSVPGSLSVMGFDDAPGAEAAQLSTMRQPLQEKGRRAGEALTTLLRGEDVPAQTLLPTHLIVRESSASVAPTPLPGLATGR